LAKCPVHGGEDNQLLEESETTIKYVCLSGNHIFYEDRKTGGVFLAE